MERLLFFKKDPGRQSCTVPVQGYPADSSEPVLNLIQE
jgi:hypothetical protein